MTRNYGLPYNSPTCGTFFYAKEYLRFLSDLKRYLNADLKQINVLDSAYKDVLFPKYGNDVILGKVLDVEIVFLHYSSFEEAKKKWNRRKARVRYDNMLVKFNDQNLFAEEDYYTFAKLPFEHKIFFTANKNLKDKPYIVYFKQYEKEGYVLDDMKTSERYFDLKKYLNEMI